MYLSTSRQNKSSVNRQNKSFIAKKKEENKSFIQSSETVNCSFLRNLFICVYENENLWKLKKKKTYGN